MKNCPWSVCHPSRTFQPQLCSETTARLTEAFQCLIISANPSLTHCITTGTTCCGWPQTTRDHYWWGFYENLLAYSICVLCLCVCTFVLSAFIGLNVCGCMWNQIHMEQMQSIDNILHIFIIYNCKLSTTICFMIVCFRNTMVSHYGHLSTAITFDVICFCVQIPWAMALKNQKLKYSLCRRNTTVSYLLSIMFWDHYHGLIKV